MLLIKIDGASQLIERVSDRADASQLQTLVGGYIESVPFKDPVEFDGRTYIGAFCDEEGKLKGKAYNVLATHLWQLSWTAPLADVLVGDVVFYEEGEVE